MAANYDNTAQFYDPLSRLVFGRAQVNAQIYLLQFIKAKSRVLIIGGGTGWVLEEISKLHPMGLTIAYVEVSGPMIALSKKRNAGNNTVEFIQQPIEEVNFAEPFDVVITSFLFDNFNQVASEKLILQIDRLLIPGSLWLFTDFQLTGKWWQRPFLKAMYLFFSIVGRMETNVLPDTATCFKLLDYKKIAEKEFFGNFIISIAYQKTGSVIQNS
jgi:ubiquinone/menaquinone biosynthesis C-methylase UbiE